MSDFQHEEDCDKFQDYSDGLFHMCLCRARLMNTFVGCKYVNKKGEWPHKVIVAEMKKERHD